VRSETRTSRATASPTYMTLAGAPGRSCRVAYELPGLERFEAAQGIATPDGGAVPYQRIAELTFEAMDALQAGLGSEQGQAAVNDIPNFATGGVTIFLADCTQ
jgi:uncharacterized protein (TIGR02118 family)